jgi:hypothetical protein
MIPVRHVHAVLGYRRERRQRQPHPEQRHERPEKPLVENRLHRVPIEHGPQLARAERVSYRAHA